MAPSGSPVRCLRTHQTADAIADAGHAVPERAVEPDLDEQDFGAWHGLTWEEVHRERGGLAHKYWVTPAHVAPPEGESFVQVMERVRRRHRPPHGAARGCRDIVAVAHGGTIRAALALALEPSTRSARSPSASTTSRSPASTTWTDPPGAAPGVWSRSTVPAG